MRKTNVQFRILSFILCFFLLLSGCSKKSPQINETNPKVETRDISNSTGYGASNSNGASSQLSQSTGEGTQSTQDLKVSSSSQQASSSTGGTNQNNGTTKNTVKSTPQGGTTATSKGDKKEQGILSIEGSGVKSQASYTLNDLKNMTGGIVQEDYFSLNNYGTKKYYHFKGISIWYLLSQKVILKESATRVVLTADDGYSVEYTIAEIKRADYISDDNPKKKYKMIIAWEEEGKEYDHTEGTPLKLVVGQKEPGDINKPNWVQNLKKIKVE